jgi:hypothetical protein
MTATLPVELSVNSANPPPAAAGLESGDAPRVVRSRRSGSWEEAVFTRDGVTIGAWAFDANSRTGPVAFEFRWGEKKERFETLTPRPDVGRSHACAEAPVCGLRTNMALAFNDIPLDANRRLPELVAIWDDGGETVLKPTDHPSGFQFRFLAFEARAEFDEHFQNPAFRIANLAVIAWAARRAIQIFPDDIVCFMSAYCIMIYRHIESGYVSAEEILRLVPRWEALERSLTQPVRGERYRWVISVKLGLGYFFLIRKNFELAERNFSDIADMEEQMASWPQASTNILIGVFMAAWLDYRKANEVAAVERLARAYGILRTGVTHLPIWSKHHFSELENSLRIARECFAFQKFLEGETRDHILPLSSKLSFRMISVVLGGMIDRGQIEDGPFPGRGQYPPAPTLRA